MANNCLVTKLKGTVSNDNLSYLGQVKVKVVSANKPLLLNVSDTSVVTALNGGEVHNVGESEWHDSITVTSPGTSFEVRDANTILLIEKYNITRFANKWDNAGIVEFNIDELSYAPIQFIDFESQECKISGSVSNLINEGNLADVILLGQNVEQFDINTISSQALARFQISGQNGKAIGSINTFIANNPNCSRINVGLFVGGNVGNIQSDVITELSFGGKGQYTDPDKNTVITGNLETMLCPNLASLNLKGTSITGDAQIMANAMWQAGRTSGTLVIEVYGNRVTWNGVGLYENTFQYPPTITFT